MQVMADLVADPLAQHVDALSSDLDLVSTITNCNQERKVINDLSLGVLLCQLLNHTNTQAPLTQLVSASDVKTICHQLLTNPGL